MDQSVPRHGSIEDPVDFYCPVLQRLARLTGLGPSGIAATHDVRSPAMSANADPGVQSKPLLPSSGEAHPAAASARRRLRDDVGRAELTIETLDGRVAVPTAGWRSWRESSRTEALSQWSRRERGFVDGHEGTRLTEWDPPEDDQSTPT